MKFAQDHIDSRYLIEAYEPGRIQVAGQIFSENMLIMPDRLLQPWELASMDDFSRAGVEDLLSHEPDVILLGTGQRQVFPHPSLFAPLMKAGTGWEIMPTDAACRTYNILLGEDRRVLAALIL
ncbi:Mth938-like domain-containing protein [Thiolapillus sp.]